MSASLEASSEYLRLALPLMSRYRIPVTPPNYAVWYAYVAGSHMALKEAIDHLMERGSAIDEEVTRELYQSHLDGADVRLEESTIKVNEIVEVVSRLIRDADSEVTSFARSLEDSEGSLSAAITVDQLRALTGRLKERTRQMSDSNTTLHGQLDESRRETETLRSELEKARRESRLDTLTGLANRAGLEEAYTALATGDANGHCLLIADIDKFKRVNDTYGHLFGDKVIRVIAQVIKDCTKGRDVAARFGGEEFVMLLPGTPPDGGPALAESIRSTIERGRILNAKTGERISHVTISIGVTSFHHHEALEDVIARADEALYRAKNGGRNRVEVSHLEHVTATAC